MLHYFISNPCYRLALLVALICFAGCNSETATPSNSLEPTSPSSDQATEAEEEPSISDSSPNDDLAIDAGNNGNDSSEDTSETDAPPSPSPSSESPATDASNQAQTDAEVSKPSNAGQPRISADAFRMAAYEGDMDKVRFGIESGMDVNGFDSAQKLTALHMAAYNGHTEIVDYLLKKGATVDCRDRDKKTPLIHACTGPFSATVQTLIKAGADVNAIDGTEGFTPLMMAAGLGQAEIVEILLSNKANITKQDEDKETAIDHARNAGHEAIVKRLESAK
ncbi:MAG: ankyrin repeat domain-containing protein [Planctomycetota bacterium]|nr:ankyrin repeat domain-containing protein [Planctomycetota bacterium]